MLCRSHIQRLPQIRKPRLPGVSYTPAQVAKLYNFPPNLDGTGQTVGIIELGGGIAPEPGLTIILVGSGSNSPDGPNGADGEVCLDNQIIREIAPGAKRRMYFGGNNDVDFAACIYKAVADGCTIISISWGGPESSWPASAIQMMESALAAATAASVSVFAAAGDNGSSDGTSGQAVDYPASSPNITGCGGTTLTASSETVWNDGTQGGATGGGVSTLFQRPTWQQVGSNAPGNNRAIPDISGVADPNTGWIINVDGSNQVIGGTSAVAPLWAALTALNQGSGKRLGFLNPWLYSLAKGVLRDITVGNNGMFVAQSGYDCCTGDGSPDGAKLLAAASGVTPPVPVPPIPPTPVPPTQTKVFSFGVPRPFPGGTLRIAGCPHLPAATYDVYSRTPQAHEQDDRGTDARAL